MILAALPEPSRTGDILMAFLSILFEGAPYILVGTLLSGFIDAFLPAKLLDRLLPRNKILSTFAAGFLGLIFPVCECAVVPVVRRLVQKGLPLSCALTYLLSAPIINPIVIVSTLTAFKEFQKVEVVDTYKQEVILRDAKAVLEHDTSGLRKIKDRAGAAFEAMPAKMTVARVSLGYVVAVLVGLFLMKRKPADVLKASVVAGIQGEGGGGHEAPVGFDAKLTHAMRTAMRDFLDTAMYFAIGVMITSVFNTQVDQSRVVAVSGHDYIAIPSMMGLAFVLALCSTSDAFIAAPMAMPLSGFASAAKLAFLVFGPMLDIKLVFMYSSIFRKKFLVWFCIALFIIVGLLSEPWAKIFFKDNNNGGAKPAVEAVTPSAKP
jgi:uncharacterized membrane protein YraQ (UPF0718 family)